MKRKITRFLVAMLPALALGGMNTAMATTMAISSITPVNTYSVSVNEYPNTTYATTSTSVSLTSVATDLGTDKATLAAATGVFYADADGTNYSDNYTASGGQNFYFNAQGKIDTWAGSGTWFVNNTFDATNDKLTFSIGQKPGVTAGTTYTATEIIYYNSKAVTINITLNVVASPTVDLSTKTNKGEYTYTINKGASDDYTPTAVSLDIAAMATAVGATDQATFATNCKLYAKDSNGQGTSVYTGGGTNGGFWFDASGGIQSWGSSAVVDYECTISSSLMKVIFYPGHPTIGTTYSDDLYLLYNDNYVLLHFKVTAVDNKLDEGSAYTANLSGTLHLRLNRTLKAGWNTLCIPCTLTAAQVTSAFGTAAQVATLTGVEGTRLKFTTSTTGITANTPCLINVSTAGTSYFITDVAWVAPSLTPVSVTGSSVTVQFVGTYAPIADLKADATSGNDVYYISSGKFFKADASSTAAMKGYRGYFLYPKTQAAKALEVTVDDVPTAIAAPTVSGTAKANVYTLGGQLVRQGATGTEGLAKGVYLFGGKKIAVK